MFIYVSKTFTAHRAGHRLREVTCEKCRTAFLYRLTRSTTGSGTAPYYIGQSSAQKRAEREADESLQKRLDRDEEMVSCPKCYWVNEHLIEAYRKTRYRKLLAVGIGLAIVAFFCLLGFWVASEPDRKSSRVALFLSIVVASCIVGAARCVRHELRKRINPNRTYPRRPALPPGTPPALTQQRDPATGEELLAPANPADGAPAKWLEFRLGQLVLPQVCCECLEPADTVFATPFKINEQGALAVPMCHRCRAGVGRSWWLSAGKWLFLAPAAGWGAFLIPEMDKGGGDWFLFVVISLGILVASLLVKGSRLRPYKLKTLDADRAIFGIHLRNPGYHARVAEALRNKELVLLEDPRAEVVSSESDGGRTGGFPIEPVKE